MLRSKYLKTHDSSRYKLVIGMVIFEFTWTGRGLKLLKISEQTPFNPPGRHFRDTSMNPEHRMQPKASTTNTSHLHHSIPTLTRKFSL